MVEACVVGQNTVTYTDTQIQPQYSILICLICSVDLQLHEKLLFKTH